MKKKHVKRMMALLLTAAMFSMSACGNQENKESQVNATNTSTESVQVSTEGEKEESKVVNQEDLPVITYYSLNANLPSGIQTGHRGELFAERGFQLEVWAYSAEKTNAIVASGDLPDIMLVPKDHLEVMIEEGMILNLDEYLDDIPHLYENENAEIALQNVRDNFSAGTGSVYGLPSSVGVSGNRMGISSPTNRNPLKLNWEVYEKIGAPEIKDVWSLIDVMEEMVEAQPELDGEKMWGTCITSGSDSNSFMSMQSFFSWHGYGVEFLPYLLEQDYVNETVGSILEEDSLYHEGLKWYNEVYRRGLLDPDSMSAERATMLKKTESGYVMVPAANFLGPSPTYLEYLLPGTTICSLSNPVGTTNPLIAISADTEHLEECLAYLGIICNPDDVMRTRYGGDGDGIWYSDNGVLRLTDRFIEYAKETGDFVGYLFDSGEEYSIYNTSKFINTGNAISLTTEGGKAVPNTLHYSEQYQSISMNTEGYSKWKETMGYNDWISLLEDKDALCESSSLYSITSYFEVMDDKMKLTMASIKDTVVNASWQMVYAESEEEFDKIWAKMVSDCEGLGAQDLIDWANRNIENVIK